MYFYLFGVGAALFYLVKKKCVSCVTAKTTTTIMNTRTITRYQHTLVEKLSWTRDLLNGPPVNRHHTAMHITQELSTKLYPCPPKEHPSAGGPHFEGQTQRAWLSKCLLLPLFRKEAARSTMPDEGTWMRAGMRGKVEMFR